jgi:hypothetical protein
VGFNVADDLCLRNIAVICFLVYSPQSSGNIADSMGLADYSYYFVMQRFLPVLQRIGLVIQVRNPALEADRLSSVLKRLGVESLLLSFAPPNKTPQVRCTTLPVFAWEYSTIPTESWGGDERNNWQFALSQVRAAITHSGFAVAATQLAMGENFPVCSLPAPVWDIYSALRSRQQHNDEWILHFSGLVLDSHELGLRDTHTIVDPPLERNMQRVVLRGVVYAAVFNPNDGRKNWHDTLWAFCWAFRDNWSATLLIKLVHHDARFACEILLHEMKKLAPYKCRVVVIHGFLDDDAYQTMVNGVTYVVNSSYGEGQCLPLMEFMSAGKPALAPDHTAMADYITAENAFVLRSGAEWTHWPHDPRLVLRAFRYRLDWQSLFEAYTESYTVATSQRQRYQAMSQAATDALRAHCSRQVIERGLRKFLNQLGFADSVQRRPSLLKRWACRAAVLAHRYYLRWRTR